MANVVPMRRQGTQHGQQEQPRGAVSNHVYDVVSMFQSKLEALAAYDKYVGDLGDDAEIRQIVEQMRAEDARHVELLRAHIEKMCREGRFH
jgi:hypothetical protein